MIAAVALAVAFTPVAAAGTLDDPELSDPAGDVDYSPLAPAEDGHPYIDILAAFASFNAATDRVNLSLVLADTSAMEEDLGNWRATCTLSVDLVRGGDNVTLDMVFEKDGASPIEFYALIDHGDELESVDEEFETGMSFSQRGIANWSFARGYLGSLGDRATNFVVDCGTMMRAAGAPTIVVHSDDAVGTKNYTIPDASPSSSDPFDPADDLPEGHRGNETGDDGAGSESPAVSAALVMLGVAAVAVAARRR